MNLLSTVKNYLSYKIGLKCIHYENTILSPSSFRFCGSEFSNDKYYLDSAKQEVERLINEFALSKTSHILEIGCGARRLAIGLIALWIISIIMGLMLINVLFSGVIVMLHQNTKHTISNI